MEHKNVAHQGGSAKYKKESVGGIDQNDSYTGRITVRGKAPESKSGANICDKSVLGKPSFECDGIARVSATVLGGQTELQLDSEDFGGEIHCWQKDIFRLVLMLSWNTIKFMAQQVKSCTAVHWRLTSQYGG